MKKIIYFEDVLMTPIIYSKANLISIVHKILYLHRENVEYSFKYVGLTRARFYLYDIEIKEINI